MNERCCVLMALAMGALIATGCRYEPSPLLMEAQLNRTAVETSPEYRSEIEAWQRGRAEGLQREGGWLSLVGLEWIEPGLNSVGSAADSMVTLPSSVPDKVGTILLRGRDAEFEAAPGVEVTSNGQRVHRTQLVPDSMGEPTELRIGTVTFHLIERAGRYAVRVRDTEAPARRNFRGLEYFPVDERYRVKARFIPYDPPKQIPVANIIGITEPMISPGALEFEIDGRKLSLDPVLETPDAERLFVIFGDRTNGRETYGAGRYFYADPPREGNEVVLDFNRAYNPPCVFTDYATCPLPPPQNKLPIEIPAGEKNYKS